MRSFVKKLVRSIGYDVTTYRPNISEQIVLGEFFSRYPVDLILDVGANEGQFVNIVRSAGYQGRILSFEPQFRAHSLLTLAASQDSQWTIWERTAIGKISGEVEINISANSVSSSILPILKSCVKAAPQSGYISKENVKLCRLDNCASEDVKKSKAIYLKIDTQGYEVPVIEGAANILSQIGAIQIELSLIQLYEGEILFPEMIELLYQLGYKLHTILPGFTDPLTGRMLQCDGIFISDYFKGL